MTDKPTTELLVDTALRKAHENLIDAARLMTTTSGERAARVIGAQFDTAIAAVETLIELRAGDRARTATRFGVGEPNPQSVRLSLSEEAERMVFGTNWPRSES